MGHWFINRYPVFKPVGPLSTVQSKVVLFRNQSKRFESCPNGLGATAWMVYKQPERHESCTNYILEHSNKIIFQARLSQCQHGSATGSSLCWCWLGLTHETNKLSLTWKRANYSLVPRLFPVAYFQQLLSAHVKDHRPPTQAVQCMRGLTF